MNGLLIIFVQNKFLYHSKERVDTFYARFREKVSTKAKVLRLIF